MKWIETMIHINRSCLIVKVAIVMLLLLVAGCQRATEILPTLQLSPLGSAVTQTLPSTRLPTLVASASSTFEPRRTATPSPTSTLTPLPTLRVDDVEKLVLNLLTDNAGCQLPCWWGITPGETDWEIAQHFLISFATNMGQGESTSYVKDEVHYELTSYGVGYSLGSGVDTGLTNYDITNEIVDLIWVLPRGTELSYQLHHILITYGQPESVLFEADTDYSLFHLLLYYPNKGITALYEGKFDRLDETYRVCPQGIGPELWLWSPGKVFTLVDNQFIGPDIVRLMRPISEVTDLDLETFYRTYQSPETPCFETPRSIWEIP